MAFTLSIDPGYRNLGWVIVNNYTLEIVAYNVTSFNNIKKNKKPSTHELAVYCGKFVHQLITELQQHNISQRIRYVIIEDFKDGINRIVSSAICGALAEKDVCNLLTINTVYPVTVRSKFNKYGSFKKHYGSRVNLKEQVKRTASILYPVTEQADQFFGNDHLADAYLQALYSIIYISSSPDNKKKWLKVMDTRHLVSTTSPTYLLNNLKLKG
jgi:Holliday junction resolvasome RuvABC endonuclease subunit